MRRRRTERGDDPLAILGLPPDATRDDVIDARRRLSKEAHPDTGGSVDQMQRINGAADEVLRRIGRTVGRTGERAPAAPPAPTAPPPGARHDHPSFTVEALPAVTFEALSLVASRLGETLHDDPPDALEVDLSSPWKGWCRLDVAPDAGASTVSIAVAAEPGWPVPDLDRVRDAWINGLNLLDWSDPDEPQQPS